MKKAALWLSLILLSACASTPTFQEQISSLRIDPSDAGKVLVVRVADANNPISNGMIIAALEAGTSSNASKQITELFAMPNTIAAVAGASQGVNVATLKRAIKDFSGTSTVTVYIQADEAQLSALRALAQGKGITVKGTH